MKAIWTKFYGTDMSDPRYISRRAFGAGVFATVLSAPAVLSAQSVNERAGTVLMRTNNYTVREWKG